MRTERPMKSKYSILIALFVLVASIHSVAFAEPGKFGYQKCLDVRLSSQEIKEIRTQLNNLPESDPLRAKDQISVPVYFHIIQDSGENNPATVDQINEQMNVLNSSFASTGFSFTLAGIETIVNDTWAINLDSGSEQADEMKSSLHQGDSKTLNIYLTEIRDDLLGYATFPWEYEEYPALDGIVVLSSTLPGGDAFPYDGGKTTVHETGHWLGLLHTFQPPESVENGCKGAGDLVSDTPAEKVAHYSCRRSDSCRQRGADPIRNYMNYTPDACQRQFTRGQAKLMQDMWVIYRDF